MGPLGWPKLPAPLGERVGICGEVRNRLELELLVGGRFRQPTLQRRKPPEHANPATCRLDPQGLGLMDMLGNVEEWCQDRYRQRYERSPADEPSDPHHPRVMRGGSFASGAEFCRATFRLHGLPSDPDGVSGVRVSRTVR